MRKYITTMPRSTAIANKLLLGHYNKMEKAQREKQPVVWVSIDFPAHILWAMDIVPVFPQVHATFQAQRKKVKKMLLTMENKWGLPHSLCGEVKAMIGTLVYGDDVAFALPHPDFMVSANCSCGAMTKGAQYLSEHLDIELLFADFPYVQSEVTADMIEYSVSQLWQVITRLEQGTGAKLTLERIRETARNQTIIMKLWEEICLLNTAIPAAADALDLFLFSSTMTMLPSNQAIIDLLVQVYNEIYEQIEKNQNRAHSEKFRILWHFLPISAQKKFFKKLFDQHGISIATTSYFPLPDIIASSSRQFSYPINSRQIEQMRERLDVEERHLDLEFYIESYVKSYLELDVNRSIDYRQQMIRKLIEQYRLDGVIIHCDRSCRSQSLPQYELRRYLAEELDIPVLIFDADSLDDRFFSASQVTTRCEAFIEKLNSAKAIAAKDD